MTVLTMKGEEARNSWRDIIDTAFRGGQVVIQRYDKPVAVLVNYEAWQEWQAWKQQRRAYLDKLSAEIDAGHYFTQEQVEQGLRERGLID
jgi:hypothetical protein